VPVGKTDPVKVVGATVAVKVIGWLTDGFAFDETTVVVDGLWLTV
jgi:FKBP-type peptidyl-prolyl cis-trans isomerase